MYVIVIGYCICMVWIVIKGHTMLCTRFSDMQVFICQCGFVQNKYSARKDHFHDEISISRDTIYKYLFLINTAFIACQSYDVF